MNIIIIILFSGKPALHDTAKFRIVKYTYGNESAFCIFSGGGGGGFYSSGGDGTRSGEGGKGGKGFRQGGVGGQSFADSRKISGSGGFGGGGGAGWGGGGGGGYSGGSSGKLVNDSCGGGGGSYNVGEDQQNDCCYNTAGHGLVAITLLWKK